MASIIIIPVDIRDPSILLKIAPHIERTFHREVSLGPPISIPPSSYDPMRDQYHSTAILRSLIPLKKGWGRVLGVTDVDLYVPGLNFVFGEADVINGVALISLKRLREGFYGLPEREDLFLERAVKEAVHELGHTYGLAHCPDPGCVMHFSNSLRDTDIKGKGFCPLCERKLRSSI